MSCFLCFSIDRTSVVDVISLPINTDKLEGLSHQVPFVVNFSLELRLFTEKLTDTERACS